MIDTTEKVRSRLVVTDLGSPLGPCWIWPGSTSGGGHGRVRVDGRMASVHRVMWEYANGPIPSGLHVGHRCRDLDPSCTKGAGCPHRRCANPEHLALMTNQENVASGRAAAHATGFCRSGLHDITAPGSLYSEPGGRPQCRACRNSYRRTWWAGRKVGQA